MEVGFHQCVQFYAKFKNHRLGYMKTDTLWSFARHKACNRPTFAL